MLDHFLAIALFLTLPVSGRDRPAMATPLNLNTYVAELDRWSAAAARLTDHPEEAAQLRQSLPPAWSVEVEGQHFSVSTAWIESSLASLMRDHGRACFTSAEIQSRLSAMRFDAEALERGPAPLPDQARSTLDRVLRRREFRGVHGPSPAETLRERLAGWLSRLAEKLFGGLAYHARVGIVVGWSLALIVTLLLVVWTVGSILASRPPTALDLKGRLVVPKTWRDWAREAFERAERSDYRGAIRLAYWSAVYRLSELGVWKVELDRTPREYLHLLPEHHAQQAPLEAVTRQFESAWYAGCPVSSEDFRSTLRQLERMGCEISFNPVTGRS